MKLSFRKKLMLKVALMSIGSGLVGGITTTYYFKKAPPVNRVVYFNYEKLISNKSALLSREVHSNEDLKKRVDVFTKILPLLILGWADKYNFVVMKNGTFIAGVPDMTNSLLQYIEEFEQNNRERKWQKG